MASVRYVDDLKETLVRIRHQGYKTFFMLNSAEHEIYPAH